MKKWQDDLLDLVDSAKSARELFDGLLAITRELGFEYCAYGIKAPFPISSPKVTMLNNYPSEWCNRYCENNYVLIDPTVKHAEKSLAPIIWDDDFFASTRDFWEEAQSYGLRFGLAQSSRDLKGFTGLLTLARSEDPLDDRELSALREEMFWLTQISHLAMSKLLVGQLLPECEVALTAKEAEVLRWTAEGKTSAEISLILQITERTVNYHINNACVKLGAVNRTAAAVRAALLGLI